jgi:hypothetical protein
LSGKLGGIDVVSASRGEDFVRSFVAKEPDPLDELCQSLFARITETVISHQTEDWVRYYDKLCAVVCRVVSQSDLNNAAKAVLTRRLIDHIVELEKWWPRLRPKSSSTIPARKAATMMVKFNHAVNMVVLRMLSSSFL